jgi:hypothetical protein
MPSNAATTGAAALGLLPSTGGLMANWTIINVVNSAAWSGQAAALAESALGTAGGSGTKVVTYASQVATAVPASKLTITGNSGLSALTSDPLLQVASDTMSWNIALQALTTITTAQPVVAAGYYDLPDLSTPDLEGVTSGATVDAIQTLLLKTNVLGEFMTDAAIAGSTDWVFTMPTRRYSVAMAYNTISATLDGRRFNKQVANYRATAADSTAVFNQTNTSVVGRLICVSGAKPVPYSREEDTPASSATVVVSPATPTGNTQYCGEASVLSFNSGGVSGALRAAVAVTGVDATYANGWARINTNSFTGAGTAGSGLPILGGFFGRALNGAQGYGFYQNYRTN